MLILTRRVSETIILRVPGQEKIEIEVCLLGIRGNQARIGVSAPKTVTIHREEIQKRIDQENWHERPEKASSDAQ